MSGILPADVFSATDLVDIRRFCGFAPYGTGVVSFVERFTREFLDLETRMASLTATEAAVVQTYLTNLRTLEAAIPAAGVNLDTDSAAVWFHNKNEVQDRLNLYRSVRLLFCEVIGVQPGPYLRATMGPRLVVG